MTWQNYAELCITGTTGLQGASIKAIEIEAAVEPSTSAHPPCLWRFHARVCGMFRMFRMFLRHFLSFFFVSIEMSQNAEIVQFSPHFSTPQPHQSCLLAGLSLGYATAATLASFWVTSRCRFIRFIRFMFLSNSFDMFTKSCSHESWRGIQATTPYCSCSRAATWLKGARPSIAGLISLHWLWIHNLFTNATDANCPEDSCRGKEPGGLGIYGFGSLGRKFWLSGPLWLIPSSHSVGWQFMPWWWGCLVRGKMSAVFRRFCKLV